MKFIPIAGGARDKRSTSRNYQFCLSDASEVWPRFVHLNISDVDPIFLGTAPGAWDFPRPAQSRQVYAFPNRGGKGLTSTQPFPEQHGKITVRLVWQDGHSVIYAIFTSFTSNAK